MVILDLDLDYRMVATEDWTKELAAEFVEAIGCEIWSVIIYTLML